jgi:hypothetical protein
MLGGIAEQLRELLLRGATANTAATAAGE